ncbi:MAG: hypothetical protein FWD53_06645 [Phycisphaerales bacterium]|nr:hypothetical protein [Phycisphaerales bacterium]
MKTEPPILSYASPIPLAVHGDIFQHDGILVVRDNTTLPELCILCGKPAANMKALMLKFTWDPSFKRTESPSTLELRRAGSIRAHLCVQHFRSYRIGRFIGWLGMCGGILLMLASLILAALSEISVVPRYTPHAMIGLLTGFAITTLFLFIFTLKTRTLGCVKIEQSYLYLAGAHPDFLKTLPMLPI